MVTIVRIHAKGPITVGKKHPLEITYKAPAGGQALLRVNPAASLTIQEAETSSPTVTLPASTTEKTHPVDIVIRSGNNSTSEAEIIVLGTVTEDNCFVALARS